MPIYTRQYVDVFENARAAEDAVRRYLALVEMDLRETSLLAMASWQDAGIPRDLWKPALPNLFRVAAGLQEPTFGRWNGMLHALREALACVGTTTESVSSPGALIAILDWLRAPAEPDAIESLRALAPLLHYSLPARASRWDAISLSVCLRNRIAHDAAADDAWWSAIAPYVHSVSASFAAVPPCIEREGLVFPQPWFVERQGIWHAFSGIRGEHALFAAAGGQSLRVSLTETELIAAFQQVLGQAELQQSSFRELMKRLAPEEHKGVLLGDFLLGPPAAEGGFAVVHRGYQLSIERKVALKVFPDALTQSKRALLRREAERLGAFSTPEIVRLIGFYEEIPWTAPREISLSGEPWFEELKKGSGFKTFLAMEWVSGEDLAAVVERPAESRPPLEDLIGWFETSAVALAKVHAAGLTHMDVNPNNIRVTPEGQIKLMDFGIARSETERQDLMTRTRLGVGTPAYMAPEQFDDQGNRQSDVYSLCATFYELFTGRRLYDHDRNELQEVNRRKREGIAPESPGSLRAEIPWEVETLLLGGLHTEPGLRPTSRQLAEDLRRIIENRPIKYRRPPLHRRVRLWYRRHRPAVRVAAPAMAGLLFVAIVLGVFWRGAERRSGELGKEVGTFKTKAETESKRADSASKLAETESKRAKSKGYIAAMRAVPDLWKGARVDLIRDQLRPYAEAAADDPRGFEWYYWDRLVNAASVTWKAEDPIRSLDWSPDGRTLYGADVQGRVLSWNRATGEGRQIRGVGSGAIAAASASSGSRLAITIAEIRRGEGEPRAPSSIDIVDTETGKELRKIATRGFGFRAAAFGPNGRRLLTSDVATSLLVWDAVSGKAEIDLVHNPNARRDITNPMAVLDAHDPQRGPVHALAFSPVDASVVASGGDDGAIGLWNTRTGRHLGWLGERRGPVASVSFSRDGTKLVSHSLPRPAGQFHRVAIPGEIDVWRVQSRERIRRIELAAEYEGVTSDGFSIRRGNYRADFLADDRLIVAAVGNVVNVWDIATGFLAKELKGHAAAINTLRASPDGALVASADAAGEMRVWNLNETEEVETIKQFEGPARSVASSSAAGEPLVALVESAGGMSSNGTVDPSENRGLFVFNKAGGGEKISERGSGYYLGTAQSPAGGRVATFDMLKEEIIVWDIANGKVIRVFPVKRKDEAPKGRNRGGSREKVDVRCLAFRDDDELYAVTGEGLWRLRVDSGAIDTVPALPVGPSPREAATDLLIPEDAVMALCFSADGLMAAAGTGGREVIVYEAGTWKELARLSGHSRGITGVSFSSDGRRLASSSGRYFRLGAAEANDRPGEVIVWDTTTWQDCLKLTHSDASEFAGVAFGDRDRTLFAAANPVTVSPGKLPRGEIVRWVSTAGVARIASANAVRSTADSGARAGVRDSKPVGSPTASPRLTRSGETKPLEGAVFRSPGMFMGIAGIMGFTSVAVHPTGELIAAATVIGRLILWDARTQEVVAEAVLPSVSWPGYALRFSPDGSHLICTIGDDVFVRSIPGLGEAHFENAPLNLRPEVAATIRRIKIGGETIPIEPDLSMQGFSPFSRDGELLARAARGDSPSLEVISLSKKSKLFSVPLAGLAMQFGFSADGRIAYAVTRPAVAPGAPAPASTIERWEVPTGKPLGATKGIMHLTALSPDLGRTLELANGIELYARDLTTGQRASAPFATESGLRGVAFFPDGEHVATFGGQNWTKAWKVSTALKVPENLLFRTVGAVLVAPDDKTIAYVDPFGWPGLYDVAGHRLRKLAPSAAPRGAAGKAGARPRTRGDDSPNRLHGLVPWHYTADGRTLVAASVAGSARANPTAFNVDRAVEVPIETRPEDVRPPAAPTGRSFGGFLLAMHTGSDSKAFYLLQGMQQAVTRGGRTEPPYILWDGAESRAVPALGETVGGLKLPCFSPKGTFVAGVLPGIRRRPKGAVEPGGPAVVVLSTSDGKLASRIPCGSDAVISLRFTGAEDAVLIHQRVVGNTPAPGEFSLTAYDPRSGRELNRRAGLRNPFLAVSDDGTRLASPVDGAIAIESLAKKTELGRIPFDDGPMHPVAFMAAGAKLITSGANGAIRIWESSGRPIASQPLQEEPIPPVETAAPTTKPNASMPKLTTAEPLPTTAKAGKPSQARMANELHAMATRLNGSPQGAYRGRFPALAVGCEALAAKLAAGETAATDIAKEMERFIRDAKGLKEEGGKRSPYKDFSTTYTDNRGRSGQPGYKARFFHEARDVFGKPISRPRETPMQYGQRLFAEMIMMLERQIEELTGKLPESSLLEEWRKAAPKGTDKSAR